ncbi:hypothetical protein [Leucobacter musarum]|uniref:hypothetical protein n=1 Tax=Leucobacter musarum TaxID=1930747 RepID=UPI0006A7B44B|nr:hypothetical protein [Leucobacter musarum]
MNMPPPDTTNAPPKGANGDLVWFWGLTIPLVAVVLVTSFIGRFAGYGLLESTIPSQLAEALMWMLVYGPFLIAAVVLIGGAMLREHRGIQIWYFPLLAIALVLAAWVGGYAVIFAYRN